MEANEQTTRRSVEREAKTFRRALALSRVRIVLRARATTIESSPRRRRILIWLTLQMIPIQIEIACLCHGNKLPPLRSTSSSTGFIWGFFLQCAVCGKCAIGWLFSSAPVGNLALASLPTATAFAHGTGTTLAA